MDNRIVECALTVQGPNDHIGEYVAGGAVCFVALCLLVAYLITTLHEARCVRLDQQNQHMRDELARLRQEAVREAGR